MQKQFSSFEEAIQFVIDKHQKLDAKFMAQNYVLKLILGHLVHDGSIDKDDFNLRIKRFADDVAKPVLEGGWTEEHLVDFQNALRSYLIKEDSDGPTFEVIEGGKD